MPSRKRRRSSATVVNKKRILMDHPFETPHPSIQTQDQIFKLPSSQPRYSPNLSPVPIPTTGSRNLKENRVSTPWTEHTSKTLTFGGRSASVSSSNSSSSTKSKDPQRPTTTKKSPRSSKPRNSKSGSGSRILVPALASPFISRASSPIDDRGSKINPNDLRPPYSRLDSRSSSTTKRGLSDTFYNPNLPFPPHYLHSQTHTAGLHEKEKAKGTKYRAKSAHTSPSSKAPPALLNLNTQLKQKKRKGGHRGTVSVDSTRGKGATEVDLQEDLGGGRRTKKKQEGRQRERRPSAPSSYSLRPRPGASHFLTGAPVGLQGTKARRSRLASGLEIIHNVNNDGAASTSASSPTALTGATATSNHAVDENGFILPLLPGSHNKNTTNSAAPDTEMDWRVGIVDFNRPPSQMCHYARTTMLGGWIGGDVLSSSEGSTSSESDEDEDNKDIGIAGTQTMVKSTRASRTRTRTARPLTSGSGSAFDDPFNSGFGFGSALPSDLHSNLANLDMDLNMNLDLGLSRFGDDALGISTPSKTKFQTQGQEHFKEAKEREENGMTMKAAFASGLHSKNGGIRLSPVMGGVDGGGRELDDVDVNEEDEQGLYDQNQEQEEPEEQDTDLTTSLMTATANAGIASTALGTAEVMQLVDGRGDRTPWIMDSLISPPSQFLETRRGIVKGGYPCLEDGNEEQNREQDGGNLFSKTLSSSSPSEYNLLSSPFQLSSDGHIQLEFQPAATPTSTTNSTTTAAATATAVTSFTAKRTRSGTIVPSSHRISNIPNILNNSNNDPPGTRRTRSGTLVGPLLLPLPLAAPGTGLQLVGSGNGNPSVRRGRERGGTILAGPSPLPLPLPIGVDVGMGVGTRRTRSGTVIGRAPPPIPASATVSCPISSGRSTKETGSVPEILEEDTSNSKSSEPGTMSRADEHHSGYDWDDNLVEDTLDRFTSVDVEVNVDVEPHIDALYMPPLSSSPDPIDFLRLAHFQDYDGMREKHRFGSGLTIEEQEDEDPNFGGGAEKGMGEELVWCIADEPPSPVLPRNENKLIGRRYNKGGILIVGGGGHGDVRGNGNWNYKGWWGKGTGNAKGKGEMMRMKTRFVIDGHEEQPDEVVVEPEEGEDSNDELLLVDRSTLDIWE